MRIVAKIAIKVTKKKNENEKRLFVVILIYRK